MGYQLYRHVLNHAPENLDTAARFVLAVIADDANEDTRRSYLGMEMLAYRTGLRPDSVGKALRRLAGVGCEIRVALGKDKHGRPVYAAKGHRTVYRIPVFEEREDHPSKVYLSSDLKTEEASQRSASRPQRSASRPPKPGPQADPPPQSPQSPQGDARDDSADDPDALFGEPAPAKKPKKAKRFTAAPDDFAITDRMRAWAKESAPLVDIDAHTPIFLDHHAAKGNTFKDWTLAWQTWMRKEQVSEQRRSSQRNQRLQAVPSGTGRPGGPTCPEHRLALPCTSCKGDIDAGDLDIPRRLLRQQGPQARPDLARRLGETA